MDGCGVTHAVLLAAANAEEQAKAAVKEHPARFARFAGADVSKPESFAVLERNAREGAIGFGEIKSHVALDGPEMKRLYAMAADFGIPVLVHFQESQHFAGEGMFSTGFPRLPAVLKAFPRTTFIGHADFFWANISADPQAGVSYPKGKVKRGGLTDKMLGDYPNLYGDLSANSGRNALARDPEFTADFLKRHRAKLMFGCDCSCRDGRGTGQGSQEPLIKGKCVARETLAAVKQATAPDVFRQLTWENGVRLLKLGFS